MTARDWRAGELTLLVLALVLAVAALTSVGFLADRLRQGLERDARQMLGADFVVRADRPVDPSVDWHARALALRTPPSPRFPRLYAASPGGPLRGAAPCPAPPAQARAPAPPLAGPLSPRYPRLLPPSPGLPLLRALRVDARFEQLKGRANTIDHEAAHARALAVRQARERADQMREHAAAIDVGDEHDRAVDAL
ncbi:hypothetical protein VTA46_29325, partial [Burkholderia cenocepacia]|nr:hypothetical protein [Burkholderia cenocepacia]